MTATVAAQAASAPHPGRSHPVHAASGGISLLVLASTIFVLAPIPPYGATQSQVVDFYATHVTSGYIYQFIAGIALMTALWFLCYLYGRFRQSTPTSPLPMLMVAAGTVWVGFAVVYLGLFQIFSAWASDPTTHSLLHAFSDAYVLGFMFSAVPAGVTVIAAAACTSKAAGWPGWLRPLAALVVVVEIVGCVPLLAPDSPIKAGGFITYASVFAVMAWIAAASLAAVRTERATPRRTYAHAPTPKAPSSVTEN